MFALAVAALVSQADLTFETKSEAFSSPHYNLEASYIMAREATPEAQQINQSLFALSRPLCTADEVEAIRQGFASGAEDYPYRDQLKVSLGAKHPGFIRADLERYAYCGSEEVRESRQVYFARGTGDIFSLAHELGDPSIAANGDWNEIYDSAAKDAYDARLVRLWSSAMGSGQCRPEDAAGFLRVQGLDSKGHLLLANFMFRPGHKCRRNVAVSYQNFAGEIPATSKLHTVLKP